MHKRQHLHRMQPMHKRQEDLTQHCDNCKIFVGAAEGSSLAEFKESLLSLCDTVDTVNNPAYCTYRLKGFSGEKVYNAAQSGMFTPGQICTQIGVCAAEAMEKRQEEDPFRHCDNCVIFMDGAEGSTLAEFKESLLSMCDSVDTVNNPAYCTYRLKGMSGEKVYMAAQSGLDSRKICEKIGVCECETPATTPEPTK